MIYLAKLGEFIKAANKSRIEIKMFETQPHRMISKVLNILIIVGQFGLTIVVSLSIYMFFAILDSDFGFVGLFGLIVFQPIMGAVLSTITAVICFIVGLPIRFNTRLNNWWKEHFYITIMMAFLGLLLLATSLLPQFADTVTVNYGESETVKRVPDLTLAALGWFATAFGTLHLYPPNSIRRFIESFYDNISRLL